MVDFLNKNVLIYGLASSGVATLKLIKSLGANAFIFDDNLEKISEVRKSIPDCQFFCELNEENLKNINYMVISPGISIYNPKIVVAKKLGITVMSELELGSLNCKSPIIAITGTNGKTTITLMTTDILNASSFNAFSVGNVGTPLCEVVQDLVKEDIAVCEVSSFQLEAVQTFKPHIAVLTNITPDHINRHKSFKNYVACKKRIFENMTENDYAVLNADRPECLIIAENLKSKIYYFSTKGRVKGVYLKAGNIYFSDGYADTFICTQSNIHLEGEHNISNALASICVSYLIGAYKEAIKYALNDYTEHQNRIEFVKKIDGVDYYNDSKGTNIAATRACINTFSRPIHIIMGGSDKGYKFDEFFKDLPTNLIYICVVGKTAKKIKISAFNNGFVNIESAKDLKLAVLKCRKKAIAGDVILLSPACASFDMFSDYIDRGQKFIEIVNGLDKK
ncbi:MAG: UDP-N-acetylmuramoyl-L-alanine--D-glutamate ligase [Clostridia bacterium]|jgi:UDP-N-acetylmuramoylalanine--D-glutamate ligase